MSNNKQQPKPENPNNQFSNTEPLTHAQRVAIANTMSNNKQSSVEWLQAIELRRDLTLADWNKAKEIHRQEILETYKAGWEECINSKYLSVTYYEKTYNNQQ